MKPKVIIVDDIEFVRKTLARILTEARFDVVAFGTNGQEAIDLYTRYKPDLMTMDVVMPIMSGIEATRIITRRFPDANILMVSAMTQESLIMEAVSAGAKDYVQKPFRAEEILKAIDHLFHSAEKAEERSRTLSESKA